MQLIIPLLLAAPASAEERAGARVDVYTDNWIQVVSPAVQVGADIGSEWKVDASYAVDILSGATRALAADVVSSATTFSERRHQFDATAAYARHAEGELRASYAHSQEPDYVSDVGILSARREVLERMATLSGTARVNYDRFGTSTGESIEGHGVTYGTDLGWTHILGRTTRGGLTLAADYSDCAETLGCHASAYRFVSLDDVDTGASLMGLRERHPDTRLRGAVGGRLSQAIGGAVAVHAGYRFFNDTWQVRGHTAELAGATGLLEERLVLRLDGRASTQSAASFYLDDYQSDGADAVVPDYRSADPEMAGVNGFMAKGRAEWTFQALGPFRELSFNGRVARLWYRYHELTEIPERDAWVIGGGAGGTF